MQNVPYLASQMESWLALICIGIMIFGVWLWWKCGHSQPTSPSAESGAHIPEIYSAENVHRHADYYVEERGQVQAFTVLRLHAQSGYFLIEVAPSEGHELDRDYPRIRGWTEQLPSNQLIRQEHLLWELPLELRVSTN